MEIVDKLISAEDSLESPPVRLLLWAGQTGCIIGKGGSVINSIRQATGAEIRILPKQEVPLCASVKNDTICQITGDPGSTHAAVEAVGSLLAANPISDMPHMDRSLNPRGIARSSSAGGPSVEASFCMVVPSSKIGALIGRGGEVMRSFAVNSCPSAVLSTPFGFGSHVVRHSQAFCLPLCPSEALL